MIQPEYKADVSLIIGNTQSEVDKSKSNYYDVVLYQTMVKTYSKLTKSRAVAEDVIKKLHLEPMKVLDLLEMVTVIPDRDTQFITITVQSTDPTQSMNIANQFAKSLKEVSIKVNKFDIVMLIDKAMLPTIRSNSNPIINIALTFFVSVLFSTGLAFLLEYLDNTIKTKEDVENIAGLPVIGAISLVKTKDKDVMIY